jgi:hypothetical protein
MKKIQVIAATCALVAVWATTAGAAAYTWTAGAGTNQTLTAASNWNPGIVPGSGDTGTIGGTNVATVNAVNSLIRNATFIVKDTASIKRVNISGAAFDGTLVVMDSASLVFSDLRMTNNATLNWSSTGTLTSAGSSAGVNFSMSLAYQNSNSVVNMSAGLWQLTGNTGANSFQMDVGTFNMTGGKIFSEDIFKLGTTGGGARFNLGGTGEIYCMAAITNIQILTASVLNFEGADSALYVNTNTTTDIRSLLSTKMASTNVYINGVWTNDINQLNFSTVNIDGIDYTKVSLKAPAGMLNLMMLLAN